MNRKLLLIIVPVVAYFLFTSLYKNKTLVNDRFYISEDGGQTWQQETLRGSNAILSSLNIIDITIDPNDSDIVYIGTRENGIYRSCCKGKYWHKLEDENSVFSDSANVYDIAIDPNNSERIYAATYQDRKGRLFRSQDSGESWEEIYVCSQERYAVFSVVIDKYDSSNIYIGTAQGGFLKSTDYGSSWEILNWFDDVVSDIVINPFNSRIIYVSAFNSGVYKTSDGGKNWLSLKDKMEEFPQAKQVEKIIINPRNSNVIYTASEYGLLFSADAGDTWQETKMVSPPNSAPVLSLGIDSKDTNHLYYGAGSILYKSLTRGQTWMLQEVPSNGAKIKAIAIDPQNPDLIYLGMHE